MPTIDTAPVAFLPGSGYLPGTGCGKPEANYLL